MGLSASITLDPLDPRTHLSPLFLEKYSRPHYKRIGFTPPFQISNTSLASFPLSEPHDRPMYKRRRSSSTFSPAPKRAASTALYISRPRYAARRRANASTYVQRPLQGQTGRIHQYRQHAYSTTIIQQPLVETLAAYNFLLNQLPNLTSFTTLYDQYRVDYMEVTFRPMFDSFAITATSSTLIQQLYTIVDRDDSVPPTSVSAIREYQACQTVTVHDPVHVRRFKPGVREGVYDGTNVVAAASRMAGWLDIATTNIPHFGVKAGIIGGVAAQANLAAWTVDVWVGVSFKEVR